MKVRRLHLEDVRGISACTLTFDGDITVIHAPNERGKSTTIDALRLALTRKATSKASEVKALQPVGVDRGSLIEVDLEAGPVQLTCRKRFNREVETVLTVRAPTAETVTGDEAHERLRELLEPHVDWALFDTLWFPQGRPLESIALATPTLTERLDEAVDGSVLRGGDDIAERVEAAFLRLFTPTGRPRKDPWLDLEARVSELRDEVGRCSAELSQLEADVAERATIERDLPQIEAELSGQLATAIAEADARIEAVDKLTQQRHTAVAEVAAAQARVDVCTKDHEARRALRERLATLEQTLSANAEQLATADATSQRLNDAVADALAAVEEHAAQVRTCRDQARLAENAVTHFDACERLATLRQRQERVDDIMMRASAAEQALDSLQVDDERIEAIRQAQREVALAELQQQTASPQVSFAAHADVIAHINGEPRSVDAGTTIDIPAADDVALTIPEIATVTVKPAGSTSDLRHRVDDARHRLATLCADAGVGDADQAEQAYAERRKHTDVLRLRNDAVASVLGDMSVSELAEAIDTAAREVARFGDGECDQVIASDRENYVAALDNARDALDAAETALSDAQQRRDEAVARSDAWREQYAQLHADHARDERDHAQLMSELAQLRAARSDDDLDREVARARADVEATTNALVAIDETLAAHHPDEAKLAQQAAHNAYTAAAARRAELRDRRLHLDASLEARGAQGLGELHQRLTAQLEREEAALRRMERDARAIERLRNTLHAARDAAQRAYREPLRAGIVRYARLLFANDTVDVTLDDELRVVERMLDGATLHWDQLSAGAKEQLAILSGLAAAHIAGADGVPFVLDDTLGYADPDRVERLSALLGSADGIQVIVLTCVPDRFRATGVTPIPLVEQV